TIEPQSGNTMDKGKRKLDAHSPTGYSPDQKKASASSVGAALRADFNEMLNRPPGSDSASESSEDSYHSCLPPTVPPVTTTVTTLAPVFSQSAPSIPLPHDFNHESYVELAKAFLGAKFQVKAVSSKKLSQQAGIPSVLRKSFENMHGRWIYPPDPTAGQSIKLPLFHLKRIFVWVPEWFHGHYFVQEGHKHNPRGKKGQKDHRIPLCPVCRTNHTVQSKGIESRRALLDDDWATVLYRRYCCGCRHEWNGLDDVFLSQLPGWINENLEFVFTHRAGVHRKLVRSIVHDLVNGKGLDPAHEYIVEEHLERFTRLRKQYVSKLKTEYPETAGEEDLVAAFGEFRTKTKYNGYYSSVHLLQTVFEKHFSTPIFDLDAFSDNPELQSDAAKWTREFYLHRYQQLIDGTFWCIDGAYKVANLTVIRDSRQSFGSHSSSGSSTKAITSIFTIFNQYEQIVFQKALVTNDPVELKEQLKLLVLNRFRQKGFKMPLLLYTDRCCDDREFLRQLFNELKQTDSFFDVQLGEREDAAEALEYLQFPANKEPVHILTSDKDALQLVCDMIRQTATQGPQVLGFDIEYNPGFIPAADGPSVAPATIQLSNLAGDSWVFSLFVDGKKKESIPNALQTLLTDNRFTFVGASIKGDITRLEKHYSNVMADNINYLDLSESAVSRGYTVQSKSLDMLTRQFCKFGLAKDSRVRLSNWTLGKKLTKQQLHYAALDAYASRLVHENIVAKRDPRSEPIPDSLQPGTKVFVFTKSDAECVARATIVEYSEPKWGPLQLKTASKQRVVIKLDEVLNNSAISMYRQRLDKDIKPLRELHSQTVLWDIAHLRCETQESLAWMESLAISSDRVIQSSEQDFITPSDIFFTSIPISRGSVVESDENLFTDENDASDCESEADFSDDNTSDIFSDDRPDGFILKVRLDCFHAMNRINKTLLKSHGAYKPFMARLRDAFFLISKDDLDLVVAALKTAGLSDDEIEAKKDYDWAFFL
ncbi:hypothetical protein HDU99_005967, partial [Rhizoclosmatium hyalinum]